MHAIEGSTIEHGRACGMWLKKLCQHVEPRHELRLVEAPKSELDTARAEEKLQIRCVEKDILDACGILHEDEHDEACAHDDGSGGTALQAGCRALVLMEMRWRDLLALPGIYRYTVYLIVY